MTQLAVGRPTESLGPRSPALSRFTDAVVLITGASLGIGAAAATLFASEGALVVAADTTSDHHVVDQIARAGGSAFCVQEDLRLPDAGRLLVSDVLEIYGRLDILIHTQTGPTPGPFRTDTSNLQTSYRLAQAALPAMSRSGGGSMLFTSTISDDAESRPTADQGFDPGFMSLIRTLAARYAVAGIRVNAIHPIGSSAIGPARDARRSTSSRSAREVASAVTTLAHLANPHARATTGQIVTTGHSHPERVTTSRRAARATTTSRTSSVPTATRAASA